MLAVSGMNSASLEFVMAGNEQYPRQRVLGGRGRHRADHGQRHLQSGGAARRTSTARPRPTDNWATVTTTQLNGNPLPALWGNSWNSFATYHFEIPSTGTSVRNATAVNTQGVAIIAPWDPTVQNDPNLADHDAALGRHRLALEHIMNSIYQELDGRSDPGTGVCRWRGARAVAARRGDRRLGRNHDRRGDFPLRPRWPRQVRGCEGCLHSTLQLDKNTSCILAGQTVSLRDMAAYARQASARPLTISYRLRDLVVSRIAVLEK